MAAPRDETRPGAYEETTRGVVVRVTPSYSAADSDPDAEKYVWLYTVIIENRGPAPVRLMSRRWIITDGRGRTEEIAGDGVVGHQPTLRPGEGFRYTSGCPLNTPTGTMRGTYRMVAENGEAFEASIPLFSLHLPQAASRLH